jgi:hypothetical protein
VGSFDFSTFDFATANFLIKNQNFGQKIKKSKILCL